MGHASSRDDFSAEYVHINTIEYPRCKCIDCHCACSIVNATVPKPETGQPAAPDCPDLDSLMTDTSSEASYDEEDDGVPLAQSFTLEQLDHFLHDTGVGNDFQDHINTPLRRSSSLSMDVLVASNPSLSASTPSRPYSPLSASTYLFEIGGQFQYDPFSGASSTYLTAASHLSTISFTDPFEVTERGYDGTVLAAAVQDGNPKVMMHSYVFRPLRLVPENEFW